MALTKVLTGGIADDAIGNTKLALDADYAFTGTISGAGLASPFPTGTAVTSVGGAVTTNIAQGLCKQWSNWNGATTIADSFNTTSATDNASGDATITIANNMASANYTVSGLSKTDDNFGVRFAVMNFPANQTALAAGTYRVHAQNGNTSLSDCELQTTHAFGDLA